MVADLFVAEVFVLFAVAEENVDHHVMHLVCLEEFNLGEGTLDILTDLLTTLLVLEELVPGTLKKGKLLSQRMPQIVCQGLITPIVPSVLTLVSSKYPSQNFKWSFKHMIVKSNPSLSEKSLL